MAAWELYRGDALRAYGTWPAPATIISDGAYGVRGFRGDTTGPEALAGWYRPHIAAWSAAATPATTLWFWNTEIGWATVHPVLAGHGWDYVQLIIWDKGRAHIAGNVNGRTIRQFPVVTEVCALYQRKLTLPGPAGPVPARDWVRGEWTRSGLPLQRANGACGVKNAATRKYLTTDWLWYWPPGEKMEKLAAYANAHGLAGLAVLLPGRAAAGHRQGMGYAALPLAARARPDQRLVTSPAARCRAAEGHASAGRPPGLQPHSGQRGAPEPEAA